MFQSIHAYLNYYKKTWKKIIVFTAYPMPLLRAEQKDDVRNSAVFAKISRLDMLV